MKKLIFIPVREDSKRLPGKALLVVNNKPLWYHTYLRCTLSCADKVYVTTDSDRIKHQCSVYNIDCIPVMNAWCGSQRVAKAYFSLSNRNRFNDLIMNVQCDYPLINPKSLNLLFNQNIMGQKDFDILTLHCFINNEKVYRNKNIVKLIGSEYRESDIVCHYFTRNSYKEAFGHIGIYLFNYYSINAVRNINETYLSKYENLEQLAWLAKSLTIKSLLVDEELSVNSQRDFDKFKKRVKNEN